MQYVVGKSGVLSLGRQGEHLARRLLFTEPADWERTFFSFPRHI